MNTPTNRDISSLTENGPTFVPSEMVERVAKAMFASYGLSLDWDSIFNTSRERLRFQARAAIEAMREPTEAMFVSGDEQIIAVLNDHTFALKEPTVAVRCWHAMIDAALTEDGAASDTERSGTPTPPASLVQS